MSTKQPEPQKVLNYLLRFTTDGRRMTNEHYAAIGRVAANWAYFEATIDDASHRLAGIPATIGVCFTAQILGSRAKLDTFIALAENVVTRKRKIIDELHTFAKQTTAISERRNRAVHDVWSLDDPTNPQRLEATAKRKLRLEIVQVPTKHLLTLADEIDRHAQQFDELANRVLTRQQPSRGKLPSNSRP